MLQVWTIGVEPVILVGCSSHTCSDISHTRTYTPAMQRGCTDDGIRHMSHLSPPTPTTHTSLQHYGRVTGIAPRPSWFCDVTDDLHVIWGDVCDPVGVV